MGKTFDLAHLQEEESAKILTVLENDFHLRMKERNRLSKIKSKILEEDKLALVLASQKDFNENCCIRCYKAFFLLINPRFVCYACKFNVCKNCCSFFLQFRAFVCATCQKEKDVMAQSCDWFYETVQRRFRQCGSAKVARRLSLNHKGYKLLSTRKKIECLMQCLETMDDPFLTFDGDSTRASGRGRTSILNIFSGMQKQQQHRSSSPESSEDERLETEFEVKQRKAQAFKAAFPEETLRPNPVAENSQKEVLRRMKAVQIARFHERVHEAMTQIKNELRDIYPNSLPTSKSDNKFRLFIRKSREDLTIILKNFAQILSITIESHNLALGRTSEDVQVDIQHILQDEVENIVCRRVDVLPRRNVGHFDDTASFLTDDGSKINAGCSVEKKLAAIILRKVFDNFRTSQRHLYHGGEEEEAIRALDYLIEEGDRQEMETRHLTTTVDPDLLSLSEVRSVTNYSQCSPRDRSSTSQSHYSGSSSNWQLRSRSGIPVESLTGLGGVSLPRIGGKSADELSDLSGGSQTEETPIPIPHSAPWAGTTHEETKNAVLRQLRQQDSGICSHYDSSPPSSYADSSAIDSEYRARQNIGGRGNTKRRIDNITRDMLTANQNATGAAAELDTTAEQMEDILRQIKELDKYVVDLGTQYTPTTALRQSSDQGIATAARALRHKPLATSSSSRPIRGPAERAKLEEDIYAKASEMVNVYELIEDLESALLRTPSHSEGDDCPQHVQRWCSIEEHVVSTVERLDGDLHDVDRITMRVTAGPEHGRVQTTSKRMPSPRRGEMERSVSSGAGSRRGSRDAWEDYRNED